jgi:prepilin-type N-terminal cleavage/methylation domain-containing protein
MCRWIGSRGASPSTRTPRPSGESGFTLLEVLVAFAVLAVMIVPILQVFGGGLGSTETARAYSTAALLARSRLAEVGPEDALEEGETTGTFEGYQWRRTISRTELTAVEAEDSDEPDEGKRSRRERASDARKHRRASFADPDSGRSSLGESRGGFGERRGAFGDSRGGFGDSRGGFGERRGSFGEERSGFGRSGQSAPPTGSSGRSDAPGTGVGDAGGGQSEDMIPYEVTVTVEWGARARGGTLSLSTLRLGRQTGGAETSRR